MFPEKLHHDSVLKEKRTVCSERQGDSTVAKIGYLWGEYSLEENEYSSIMSWKTNQVLRTCYSRCGPWTGSVTQEIVRNAESQALRYLQIPRWLNAHWSLNSTALEDIRWSWVIRNYGDTCKGMLIRAKPCSFMKAEEIRWIQYKERPLSPAHFHSLVRADIKTQCHQDSISVSGQVLLLFVVHEIMTWL